MTEVNVLQGDQSPSKKTADEKPRISQLDILPKAVKARHLETGLFGVKVGLEEQLPADGSVYSFFFAVDAGKMYAWTGSEWLSSTFA